MESMPVSINRIPDANAQVELMVKFTGTFRQYYYEDKAIREAMCLQAQFPGLLCEIMEGDLFAGRLFLPAISFTPQADGDEGGFGFVYSESKINELSGKPELTEKNKKNLKDLVEFWEKEHSTFKTRKAYPAELKQGLPSDCWTERVRYCFSFIQDGWHSP